MNRRTFTAALLALTTPLRRGRGDEAIRLMNWQGPTTGGLQFWGDVAFFHDWRVQRHVVTGHHRLLDGSDVRHAWGAYDACLEKLDEIDMPPMQGEAVVLLHGLSRSRRHMKSLADYLTKKEGCQVFRMGYPSLRAGVDRHAQQLDQVMRSLAGIQRVHFVAHSLGNLVIRRWMHLNRDAVTDEPRDSRVGRFVMIGPPNNRPSLARVLGPLDAGNLIAGQSARDLNADWDQLAEKMVTPSCDFGILAGGKSDEAGWNPLIPGDDDTTVGVDETKLPGAIDFRVLQVAHRSMPTDPTIHALTWKFLQTGRFGTESERQRL